MISAVYIKLPNHNLILEDMKYIGHLAHYVSPNVTFYLESHQHNYSLDAV